MSVARIRTTSRRLTAALTAVVLTAALAGCSPGPEPPAQPPPPESGYRAVLKEFSQRMLDGGAPAVLVQVRVGADEWSAAYGVRNLDSRFRAQITDPVARRRHHQVHGGGLGAEAGPGRPDPAGRTGQHLSAGL